MTASWGGFGYLWNKSIAIIFIRPQRYTFQFVEGNTTFTLCFFDKKYKKALNICGSKSGRDTNKVEEAGLNSIITPNGSIAFKEARMIMDCRKLYADTIKPDNFIEKGIIEKIYPSSDFHKFYLGEIISCFTK
jgi:flavin reductase (DIM6/NTAB) family NADH-FMN oxidoreductase RutF